MNLQSPKSIKTSLTNAYQYTKAFGLRNLVSRTVGMMTQSRRYNAYVSSHSVSSEELAVQSKAHFANPVLISIIVPTYFTPHDYLVQMIESIISQSYPNWELCIADGSPDPEPVESVVREYQKNYPSIRYRALDHNLGIAGNTNAALEMASGDYIALLDHDDFLTPDALYEIVRAINDSESADILYTDEDKYDSSKDMYYDPNFKPDFDPDYLRCCNYITHFYVVKKEIVDQIQGFSTTMDGSQDYDFILRTTDKASSVLHIPKVLYHWRIHSNSVAGDPTSKMYAYDAAQKALNSHFKRLNVKAHAEKTANLGFYYDCYELQGSPLVSVVLKNCDKSLKPQIQKESNYHNIEFISRWSEAKGDYILFFDHVSRLQADRDWLTDLLANCQRPEIGAVSGKIVGPQNRIYEYGLIYDRGGRIVSPFYNYPVAIPGYYHLTESQHSVSVAGGHFLLVAKQDVDDFVSQTHTKGLDESFAYRLCLWLGDRRKRVILLPYLQVLLNKRPHPSFLFYTFDDIPAYIRNHPQDPMYNSSLSVSQPYII